MKQQRQSVQLPSFIESTFSTFTQIAHSEMHKAFVLLNLHAGIKKRTRGRGGRGREAKATVESEGELKRCNVTARPSQQSKYT